MLLMNWNWSLRPETQRVRMGIVTMLMPPLNTPHSTVAYGISKFFRWLARIWSTDKPS